MNKVKQAIEQIAQGKFVIVIDDKDRENEGDLIIAADLITADAITFMAKKASGLICLAITPNKATQLNLPLQLHGEHRPSCNTAFTYSIDARFGISTGIPSTDRAHTIKAVLREDASPADFVIPGHIFPLIAKDNGVLERPGHTEAAVDLARLAGLNPAGVICEIMDDNGEMLRDEALLAFAKLYDIPVISTNELIEYRKQTEPQVINDLAKSIHIASETKINTKFGEFTMMTFFCNDDHREHVALIKGKYNSEALVRIHSECLTGDVFSSLHCDCGSQLDLSLEKLAAADFGILIYLKQEGRDIGLTNKLRAYHLQQQGLDTVDANLALNLPVDNRDYQPAIALLNHYQIHDMKLLTNNPDKVNALTKAGFNVKRVEIKIDSHQHNHGYLQTKKHKLAHLI